MTLSIDDLLNRDELLGCCVNDMLIGTAYEWLYQLAKQLGVSRDKVNDSGFLVRELLTAYVFREVCIQKMNGTDGKAWQGVSDTTADVYERKYKLYAMRVTDMEKRITAVDLTGITDDENIQGYRTVTLARG